jgi:hypothetical protein
MASTIATFADFHSFSDTTPSLAAARVAFDLIDTPVEALNCFRKRAL